MNDINLVLDQMRIFYSKAFYLASN